jgi:hypothetical protein
MDKLGDRIDVSDDCGPRGELGRGVGGGDPVEDLRIIEVDLPAPLQAARVPRDVPGLPRGDHDQQPPQVVAAIQAIEATGGGSLKEAIEDVQSNVLAIGPSPRDEPLAALGKPREADEIAFPQEPRGVLVPGRAEGPYPTDDRVFLVDSQGVGLRRSRGNPGSNGLVRIVPGNSRSIMVR